MAGDMERDARLILRAEDRATKTFDQVAASIKRVRQEIVDQSKAVQNGQGDISAYNAALDELKAAGDDLVRGQSLIGQFEKQSAAVEKAEERLRQATVALDIYQKKVGDTPTDNQSLQLEKKANSIVAAQERLERAQSTLAQTEARMERAGIATDNLEQQYNQMAAAAVEAAQGIAAAKNAIDDYPNAVKRATEAAREFQLAQEFDAKDTSFLAPNEFAFIQSLDSAKAKLAELAEYEQLEARSAAAAATAEKQRRAEQLEGINRVLRGNDELDAQFKELIADEARLKDLNAFRQLGIDAAESAAKVERYAASVQSLGNDFQTLSSQVRASLGGTSSSLQDIGQALAQIDASAEMLENPKLKINDLQASAGKLTIAIATLDRTARQIDGFQAQQRAVEQAEAAFAEAQAEVQRLARAVGTADEPVEALERELRDAQRALTSAGQAMQKARNDAVKMGQGLRQAGIDTDNLENEMQRLRNSAVTAGQTMDRVNAKRQGKGGFLGLNPFEMQNLGFQINDVFTQLASGTPVFQVVAQQGGQIVQLFRGLGSTLLRLAPLIGGILVVLSPFISAMMQAAQATDALRTANTLLAGSGLAGIRDAAGAYAEASVNLQNLGATAEEATDVLKTFRDSGLDPEGLEQFAFALDNAVKGGEDMAETAKLLADALTGGTSEVEALNDALNILTPSEEDQIVAMIESGNESEARRILFEKFEETSQRMADSAQGPWSRAWDDLTFAFRNFTSAISDSTPFRALGSFFDWIGEKIRGAIDDLTYFFNYASQRGFFQSIGDAANIYFRGEAGARDVRNDAGAQAANDFARRRGRPASTPFPGENQRDTLEGNRAIRERTRDLEEAEQATRELSRAEVEAAARRRALRTAVGSPEQRQQQADLAAQAALVEFDHERAEEAEKAAKRRRTAGNREARAAETLANRRRSIEEQLIRDLETLETRANRNSIQSLEQRLAAVDNAATQIFQRIEAFERAGGTQIEGQTIEEYRALVGVQMEVLRNQEQMKFYEDSISSAIANRDDQIDAVNDALRRGDISARDATLEVEEIISRFSPQISQLASDAITFAQSLRTATPDPRLEEFISKFQRITQENSAGQDRNLAREFAQGVIDTEARKLESLIQQRDALVAAENTLVELGVRTRTEAQSNIEAAYARTTPLIQEQSRVLSKLLDQFITAYPEMQTFYDTWQAKLQGIAATSEYVDARFTQLKSGVDGLITGNALAGIDAMAQAMARLALGQQGALETLQDLGIAFANFIAETIIGLAKLILQMLLLSAIEKATGIPVGALLRVMNATGLHTGGVVGQERTFGRRVPEAAFLGAPRYHGGGVAGFAPDEVPAILKRNEEVLTEADPRHRFNLGKGGDDTAAPGSAGMRNILVMDPQELANAMAGPAGEKMVIQHIRRNRLTVKQLTEG